MISISLLLHFVFSISLLFRSPFSQDQQFKTYMVHIKEEKLYTRTYVCHCECGSWCKHVAVCLSVCVDHISVTL